MLREFELRQIKNWRQLSTLIQTFPKILDVLTTVMHEDDIDLLDILRDESMTEILTDLDDFILINDF